MSKEISVPIREAPANLEAGAEISLLRQYFSEEEIDELLTQPFICEELYIKINKYVNNNYHNSNNNNKI